MKKAGIIRCLNTEAMCPGTACFQNGKRGENGF
ncbi:MAG: hypothetical protein KCCBMMGE_00111 [Candidatus Methanoperedenaceae archaeon GB37]|nr:MAG: hypothetical protein KCCBMMGE_00111 [Candidatus Methanoperedenaceae archaeon GB37]CAD7778334.1 hypothetical protein DMNBHIDG_01760 [Candidatus Methanoperedenaceae archaeon GB37]